MPNAPLTGLTSICYPHGEQHVRAHGHAHIQTHALVSTHTCMHTCTLTHIPLLKTFNSFSFAFRTKTSQNF